GSRRGPQAGGRRPRAPAGRRRRGGGQGVGPPDQGGQGHRRRRHRGRHQEGQGGRRRPGGGGHRRSQTPPRQRVGQIRRHPGADGGGRSGRGRGGSDRAGRVSPGHRRPHPDRGHGRGRRTFGRGPAQGGPVGTRGPGGRGRGRGRQPGAGQREGPGVVLQDVDRSVPAPRRGGQGGGTDLRARDRRRGPDHPGGARPGDRRGPATAGAVRAAGPDDGRAGPDQRHHGAVGGQRPGPGHPGRRPGG